ncbi:ABC transporter ATP-binding protein [Dactylosporangium sp. NPDC051541]|uniref:ABC transporter ATP-binding protein n=1 Tax=Dactylosporangium sp. NPDC051541 TaxID=3363977 RepID=UPI0037972236
MGVLARRARFALALGWRAAPGPFAATVVLAVLGAVTPVTAAWGMKAVIDGLTAPDPAARVWPAAALLAGAGLLGAAVLIAAQCNDLILGRRLVAAAQERLFRRVNAETGIGPFEDPAFLDRLRVADESGDQAPAEILHGLVTIARCALTTAGFAATMLLIWPPMLLVALVVAVPSVMLRAGVSRRRARLRLDLAATMRRQFLYKSLLTDARAAKEVRLFGLGRYFEDRMLRELRAANRAETALGLRVAAVDLVLELLIALGGAAGVVVAVGLAVRGRLSAGDVSMFIAAGTGILAGAGAIATAVALVYQSLLLFAAYHDIVTEPVPPPAATGSGPPPPLERGIELQNVWFRYRDDGPWILRGLDLRIPAGRSVGLVGLNGAGKSTLVKLLGRLYEPQRGRILWDGVDLRDLPVAAVRARIATVFQDFMQYDLPAATNIGLGRLDAVEDVAAVRRAGAAAGIDGYLSKLPWGYRTMLSRHYVPDDEDAGAALPSGGQWQRIAVARAFMRADADLLILDEPSSGLDAEAEHALHERLRALRRGRTSLLVSHRLSTLREADVLVVLARGRVAELGGHHELLARDGEYARLFRLQAAGYADLALTERGTS